MRSFSAQAHRRALPETVCATFMIIYASARENNDLMRGLLDKIWDLTITDNSCDKMPALNPGFEIVSLNFIYKYTVISVSTNTIRTQMGFRRKS